MLRISPFIVLLTTGLLSIVAASVRAQAAGDSVTDEIFVGTDGTRIKFAMLQPDRSPGEVLPALIVFASNDPHANIPLESGFDRYWREEALKRKWVVVGIEPPNKRWLFDTEMPAVGELLAKLAATGIGEGGRFHFQGIAVGTGNATNVATTFPERVASVSAIPYFIVADSDKPKFSHLKGVPVAFFAGPDMPGEETMAKSRALLTAVGANVEVFEDVAVDGNLIFGWLEGHRGSSNASEQPRQPSDSTAILNVLDQLHAAASKADGERYFALFADDAVFLGTDATERWPIEEFKAYAMKRFATGTGWTYTLRPGTRHIVIDGNIAWFDELLENAKYGTCRGSGVLRKVGEHWKIAQYNLTFTVPNDAAPEVVKVIRSMAIETSHETQP